MSFAISSYVDGCRLAQVPNVYYAPIIFLNYLPWWHKLSISCWLVRKWSQVF